jgi:hypothetical protein
MPRCLGVTGHRRRFSGSQPMLHHATRYATLRNMPWHAIRIRSDLHRIIQAQAVEQSRSVAKQVDWLLSRALEQTSGNSPEEGGPSRLTGAPSSARASNTSPSSGGGPAQAVIPGERERGAGVDLPEVKTSGAALANDVVGASRVDPAPLDPFDEDDFKENSTASEWQATLEDPPSPQTDIYEMLAGCPECAGRMESVGDGPQRCVDCGFTREER